MRGSPARAAPGGCRGGNLAERRSRAPILAAMGSGASGKDGKLTSDVRVDRKGLAAASDGVQRQQGDGARQQWAPGVESELG